MEDLAEKIDEMPDAEFWELITSSGEFDGFFVSTHVWDEEDNLTGNE
jgi:hypothetical protein